MSASWQPLIGRIAGVISLGAFVPYVVAILRGKARPNRVTWFIWTVVGAILFATYEVGAGGAARWVPLSDALGPAMIGALAFRYGVGGHSRFDLGCLALAALSLVGWALSGAVLVALAMNLLVDLLGALPTIRKVYRDPSSEYALTWRLFFTGNVLNLFAIERWTLQSAAYPLYVVVVSGVVNTLLSATVLASRRGLRRSERGSAH